MELNSFFEHQLELWSLARAYYLCLSQVEARSLTVDSMEVRVQHNPARIGSTDAKVDVSSIKARPCFLCKDNRPHCQLSLDFKGEKEYDILVNPYPIAPKHFTIACKEHINQDDFIAADMARFAEMYQGLAVFHNGSKSGASAPDHLHFQAVNVDFLNNLFNPLCENPGKRVALQGSTEIFISDDMPMNFVHISEPSFSSVTERWISNLPESPSLRNIFMYQAKDGNLHTLIFPRLTHRPSCYFQDGEQRILCSPGAIDMAGTLILPRPQDYAKISRKDIRSIYEEVSADICSLSQFSALLLS